MTRRCSHCATNGHNTRTCPSRDCATVAAAAAGGGVRLFGVQLTSDGVGGGAGGVGSSMAMKKSASMGNLSLNYYQSGSSATASPNPSSSSENLREMARADGYASDDPNNHASCSSNRRLGERKKGTPWTEEEHRMFLIGLQQLGKGDWRGIARKYVMSRTPTQVASHAQKYFIRQTNSTRRKRRSSLFDMVPDMVMEEQPLSEEASLPPIQVSEPDNGDSLPSLNLTLSTEAEPMEATTSDEAAKESMESSTTHSTNRSDFPPVYPPKESTQTMTMSCEHTPVVMTPFYPAYIPVPFPLWQPNLALVEGDRTEGSHHEILRPIPILRKEPVNVDELVGMSHLNLNEIDNSNVVSPQLSLNLLGPSSRQSAFHASPQVSSSDLSEGAKSAIKAV